MDPVKATRREFLEEHLLQATSCLEEMVTAGAFREIVNQRRQVLQIRENLDELTAAEQAQDLPSTPAEHHLELLRDVRMRRKTASGVAASNIIKLEKEMVREHAERLEEARAAELRRRDTAGIVADVVERLLALPSDQRRAIAAELQAADPVH